MKAAAPGMVPGVSRRNAVLCAFGVALCILLTNPVLAMPVNDDFSYTRTAFDYARTGHFYYNGWGGMILGWQAIWGAGVIKLFGYSFTAVRLSILPIAMGSVYLLYLILARFGANTWNATLGALTLGFSPLFIPLAASFLTDVPAVFCILVCLYMCQKAVQSTSDRCAIAWLVLASFSNVLGGTVRQIVWFGALLMVPSAAWLLRNRRPVVLAAAALWPVCVLSIAAFMRWFRHQPYSVEVKIWEPPASDLLSPLFFVNMLFFSLTLLLFSLPLLVSSREGLRLLPAGHRSAVRVTMICIAVVLVLPAFPHPTGFVLAPWLPNVVTQYGMTKFREEAGYPLVVPAWVRLALTLLLLLSFAALATLLSKRRPPLSPRSAIGDTGVSALHQSFVLTVPFSIGYIGTLVSRAMHHGLFDRYILPIFPFVVILYVLYYQDRLRARLPWTTVVMLAAFGVYATAATHDYFSLQRARLAAAEEVERAGIPRTQIHGSLEYDAWTQMQTQGYLNEEKIQIPAGAYRPAPHRHQPPLQCRYWFSDFLSSVHPRFIVVPTPQPCFDNSSFPPVTYQLWLPPFRGTIYVQKQKDGYDWVD